MSNASSPGRLKERLVELTNRVPPGSEIARLLKNIDAPANDEASKDRYVALVAGSAVEAALANALEANGVPIGVGARRMRFAGLIERAESAGLVNPGQAVELDTIRKIRNLFAHAIEPISFSTPEVTDLTRLFWDHPVHDWTAYFLPIFAARQRFIIICGSFFEDLYGRSDQGEKRAPKQPKRGD